MTEILLNDKSLDYFYAWSLCVSNTWALFMKDTT